MGRGSMYPYAHFILVDAEVDHHQWQEIKDDLSFILKDGSPTSISREGDWTSQETIDKNVVYHFSNDRIIIGTDSSGGLPAIFIIPKLYIPWNSKNNDRKEYKIDREARRIFNKIIKMHPGIWYRPTSAWTSEKLKKYWR